MTKKIILSLFILVTSISLAQQGSSSAYSFYGVGDMKPNQTIENRSMGGVAIQADSIYVNFQNPASYGALQLTSFNFGGSSSSVKVSEASISGQASRSSFDYVALGLPIGKFGIGLGLKPVSSVGYTIFKPSDGSANSADITDIGSGSTTKGYLATGFKLFKNLYWGIEANYNFGFVNTTRNSKYTNVQLLTETQNRSNLSGFGINTGLTYSRKINKKNILYAGLTFSPSSSITVNNTEIISTLDPNNSNSVVDKISTNTANKTTKLAGESTFGLGYGENKKWFIGAQYALRQTGDLSNRTTGLSNASFENSTKISLGGYYIPNYSDYSSYFKKVTYRAGFRNENTGLVINNKSITEYGMTFGLGLPLGGTFSKLNIGFEYGSRGTVNSNLVREDFFTIMVGLSLNDKWFKKAKID